MSEQVIDQLFAKIAESYDNQTIWQVCTEVKSFIKASKQQARIEELLEVKYALAEKNDDYLNLIIESRLATLQSSQHRGIDLLTDSPEANTKAVKGAITEVGAPPKDATGDTGNE